LEIRALVVTYCVLSIGFRVRVYPLVGTYCVLSIGDKEGRKEGRGRKKARKNERKKENHENFIHKALQKLSMKDKCLSFQQIFVIFFGQKKHLGKFWKIKLGNLVFLFLLDVLEKFAKFLMT
jgi:hypothetical protein